MANNVKWIDWQSIATDGRQQEDTETNPRVALLQFIGCVVGLAGLTVVLPGPASWIAVLTGKPIGTQGQEPMGDAAETAVMLTASVLVWFLLAWVLAVWIAAVGGRLPGAPGRCGRSLLGRIAPASAGRIVAAAVGVTLIAGTSACAVPALGDVGPGASIQVASGSSMTSTPAPLGGGAGVVAPDTSAPPAAASSTAASTATSTDASVPDDVIGSISIDWPAPETSAGTADLATQTAAAATTATAPTEPAVFPDIATSPAELPQEDGGGATTTSAEQGSPSPSTDAPETQAATATEAASAEPATPGEVQVRSGDTLWSIAHHRLSPDATDQEIDIAWRAWYSANEQVIGENPDLIQPGQLLLPPDPEMGR